MVNRTAHRLGDERGTMVLDVMTSLFITAVALVASAGFVHFPRAGVGMAAGDLLMSSVREAHLRAIQTDTPYTVEIQPNSAGGTTLTSGSGAPYDMQVERRTDLATTISWTANGASGTGPSAAFVAMPDGTLAAGLITQFAAYGAGSPPPACPAGYVLIVGNNGYAIDCPSGILRPVAGYRVKTTDAQVSGG